MELQAFPVPKYIHFQHRFQTHSNPAKIDPLRGFKKVLIRLVPEKERLLTSLTNRISVRPMEATVEFAPSDFDKRWFTVSIREGVSRIE